jgi:hypothetical protein
MISCFEEMEMSERNMGVAAGAAPVLSRADLLLRLAERCEAEQPSRSLDCAIYLGTRLPIAVASHTIHPYTTSLDAAVTLMPDGWFLETLSDIFGDGMVYARLACPEPIREAQGCGGRNRALTLCAAALRARAAEDQP